MWREEPVHDSDRFFGGRREDPSVRGELPVRGGAAPCFLALLFEAEGR